MATYKRRGTRRAVDGEGMGRSLWQLCGALLILAVVLAVRFFAPEQTGAFLRAHLVGEQSYAELLETVGEGLRAFFDAEVMIPVDGGPVGGESPAATENPNGAENPEATNDPNTSESPAATAEPQAAESPGGDQSSGGTADAPADSEGSGLSLGIGGFDLPLWAPGGDILQIDERFLVFDYSDGVDDTPPVPFGFDVPERADFTLYELPFTLQSPAEGRVSSPFGYRIHPVYERWMFHYGLDIANKSGTAVMAASGGVVSAVGLSAGYGNYVGVDHGNGYSTFYAHLNRSAVTVGQTVASGQTIGDMGATGVVTGPHLHFELRKDGRLLNPQLYLPL